MRQMLATEKRLILRDGTELYLSIREKGAPFWIVATHGIGEHHGRHQYLPKLFAQDFNILQYDLRGHGKSSGKRGYVENFSDFAQDLKEILEFLIKDYRMDKYILFGHSMGALITAQYVQKYAIDAPDPQRVFLASPPISIPGPLGASLSYLPLSVTKSLETIRLRLPAILAANMDHLSHDREVCLNAKNDPLNLKSMHTSLMLGLINAAKEVFALPLRSHCPVLCAIGDKDKVVCSKAVEKYFSTIEKNANLLVIPGAYHELHHEVEKYRKPYFEFLKKSFYDALYFKTSF